MQIHSCLSEGLEVRKDTLHSRNTFRVAGYVNCIGPKVDCHVQPVF